MSNYVVSTKFENSQLLQIYF